MTLRLPAQHQQAREVKALQIRQTNTAIKTPSVILTWHPRKYKVHQLDPTKVHPYERMPQVEYTPSIWGCTYSGVHVPCTYLNAK